jgi:hypothetical protein
MGAGGGAAGAAAAAAANAVKAMGGIVQLEPDDFQRFVQRIDDPLVVYTESSFFGTRYQYVTGHRGLVFYAKSREPLRLGSRAELIRARRISMPRL